MGWQKKARLAIALFVAAFVVVVALALRRGKQTAASDQPPPPRMDEKATLENLSGFRHARTEGDKVVWSISAGTQFVYADGRQKLGGGVKVESRRNERLFTVTSKEADVVPGENGLKSGHFKGDVRLTTDDGLQVKAPEATYTQDEAMMKVPGAVEFTRGRMKGASVGATYDMNREVLWMLENARIEVAPDPKSGGGNLTATAKSIGIARSAHYVLLNGAARIDAQGRIVTGNEITVNLSEDNERVQVMQIRGGSRIEGGAGGPQAMSANDIDLTYAEDGRTLQFAKLMQNATAQLPGSDGGGGRRVSATAIDIALAPDGSTVTNLTANERVQLDLPADANGATRRIKSDALVAAGTPQGGLQEATFSGNVDFQEARPAKKNVAAATRTARANRLVTKTKAGLGAIEHADFRGNVHFVDGDTTADAPHAIYNVTSDQINLEPSEDPGPPPLLSDGKIEVRARTIEFNLTTRSMIADTKVRSTVLPQKPGTKKPAGDTSRMPSLLKPEEIVTITSNRMSYDGAASQATYAGNASLWQGDTLITADTLVLDDKSGNLIGRDKVLTKMMLEHADQKTKERKAVEQRGSAELFEYNDTKRLATYTTNAFLSGPEGEITGDRIELFLKEKGNELERAEAYGTVTLKDGLRIAKGSRLTYTVADERYLMKGTPVDVIEKTAPNCTQITGATFTYFRGTGRTTVLGDDVHPTDSKKIPCGAPGAF